MRRMAVEAMAASVVTAGRTGVGVAGGVLDVFERDAGLSGSGDESDPQRVRPDLSGTVESGMASNAPDNPPGLGLAHAPAGGGDEQRTEAAAGEVGVEGTQRRGSEHRAITPATLALEPEDPMAPVVAEVIDVPRQRLTDSQTPS